MLSRIGLLQILGLTLAAIPGAQAVAAEKVGAITYLVAWRNTQPPNNKIIAIGRITAPNPCYKAEAEPLMLSDKSLLKIKITLKSGGGTCIQKISDVDFRYEGDGTGSIYTDVEASSETDTKKAPIGTAS